MRRVRGASECTCRAGFYHAEPDSDDSGDACKVSQRGRICGTYDVDPCTEKARKYRNRARRLEGGVSVGFLEPLCVSWSPLERWDLCYADADPDHPADSCKVSQTTDDNPTPTPKLVASFTSLQEPP